MVQSYYRTSLAAFDQFERGIGFSYWLLFDMQAERPERFSVARENPDVLERMLGYLDAGREQFEGLRTQPPPTTVP